MSTTKQGVPSLLTKDRSPKTKLIGISVFGLWVSGFGLWSSVFRLQDLGFGLWTFMESKLKPYLLGTPCYVVLLEYRSGHYKKSLVESSETVVP